MRAPTSIPGDYESLKGEYIGLAEELSSTQTENEKLKEELAWFRRQIFGQKSERFVSPDQLTFDELKELKEQGLAETEIEPEPEPPPKNKVNRAKPGRKPLPKDLPRKQVIHIPDEVQKNESEYEKIGEEINEELNFIPAKMEVVEHVYPKYKRKADGKILQDNSIYRPILKGRPGAGLLAHVLVSKYCDHLPLDRQERIFKRQKIDIPKSTMVHWTGKCYEILLPIYEKMKEQILSGGYVLSDDTSVQVLDKNIKGKSHRGYLWTYGDLSQVVYDYTHGRSRDGPHSFLKNYSGFLQTDGYGAYNDVPTDKTITRIGCWAHARRKFFELKDTEPGLTRTPLLLIGELFEIERQYSDKQISFEDRKKAAEKIQGQLKQWLDKTTKNILPASSLAGAIKYSLNQWDRLTVYQNHPHLKIDNNFSERCIKTAVIGRKNWLFFGSEKGADRSAVIYSVVESCKIQGHNPWEYLNDVFSRVDEKPMNIENLTPRNWKKKERA